MKKVEKQNKSESIVQWYPIEAIAYNLMTILYEKYGFYMENLSKEEK